MTDPATAEQLAQINAKLDVMITQHATVAAQAADHEVRLRAVETKQTTTEGQVKGLLDRDQDQETRLRKADQWRYAIPATAITGTGALLAGAAALVTSLGG
ncbi:hypothetical protein [Actinomadura geliboluensis]|uniref:hypothetical protein n=1 Tax=Actinomadura geliboluensis TaxID=882440 RepID=UPI00367C6863